ncbi:hypothetical protein ACFSC4_31480 [Deinococcus malanensis]|uniref:hypothetical protein n=1 Tax=Deinococcus malanensis TaxID=1706855 RepID=UPI00166E9853|nr:hypothetical protein [Deinococcus malanensis]
MNLEFWIPALVVLVIIIVSDTWLKTRDFKRWERHLLGWLIAFGTWGVVFAVQNTLL